MTFKFNWGTKIALLYIGFVAMIVTLVIMASNVKFDLVTKDYYNQELKFQHQIDAAANQKALSQPLQIKAADEQVSISFPPEMTNKLKKINVYFMAMVHEEWDQKIEVHTLDNSIAIDRSLLRPTRYQVKVNWQCEGTDYFQQSDLFLH